MAVEWEDLELEWPPELLAAEARALLADEATGEDTVGWLMAEAFHGDRGLRYYREQTQQDPLRGLNQSIYRLVPTNGRSESAPLEEPRGPQLLRRLAEGTQELRRHHPPQYFSQRQRQDEHRALGHAMPAAPAAPWDVTATAVTVLRVLADLEGLGYFADAFGSACCDSGDDPDAEGQLQLADLLRVDVESISLWPPRDALVEQTRAGYPENACSFEELFDLIEALHDVVARPRERTWHDFEPHWDYGDFTRSPGRAVFRWRINDVLERAGTGLQLAESGEDTGRLVRAAGDDRDKLVQQVKSTPRPDDRAAVDHAVALFRARGATRYAKRSAVVVLARLLEGRRPQLKAALVRKDEGALFQIANEFDVRHREAKQHADYDDAFLDWVFWWYLATVELSDRILVRQRSTAESA